MLKIVTDGDDDVVTGGPDAAQQRIVLAVIAHEVDGTNPAILPSHIGDDIPAAIGTAVVDQDELKVLRNCDEHGFQSANQLGEDRLTALNRDDDGNLPWRQLTFSRGLADSMHPHVYTH